MAGCGLLGRAVADPGAPIARSDSRANGHAPAGPNGYSISYGHTEPESHSLASNAASHIRAGPGHSSHGSRPAAHAPAPGHGPPLRDSGNPR